MLPRRLDLDPSGVEAGGESGGEHNLTRKWGGVSGKQWRGCQAPRFHFSLSLFGFFVLDRTTRTAPAERERTGATPAFSPLARFGERGGVSPGVRHRVRRPRRLRGVAPVIMYPCRKAPRPARGPDDEPRRVGGLLLTGGGMSS